MSNSLTLSIDAMGGENAPHMVLEALRRLRPAHKDVDYLLFGNESVLNPLLEADSSLQKYCQVRHAPDVVKDSDKPSAVLRNGKSTSMWQAINAVRENQAKGVISSGNTGALMAMSKTCLKTLSGVQRPAIVGLVPTQNGPRVMLDVGGNTSGRAENLVEFAIMGEVFARAVLGIPNPSVALLNIGSEEMKGREEIREAARILRENNLSLHFRGYVEGHNISQGDVDVIVTDGFTGNVALKTMEGTAKLASWFLKDAFRRAFFSRIGFLLGRPALKKAYSRMDPRHYNGAMFIGLNGISVKSHGGADAVAFSNAVETAVHLARHKVGEKISSELDLLDDNTEEAVE